MANTNAPFGFTPIRRVDGAAWSVNLSQRMIKATNTNKFFQGDVVSNLTGGSRGYIDVTAPGTQAIAGIFYGCYYLSNAFGRRVFTNQFPGGDTSQDIQALIIDDPLVVFRVQCKTGPMAFATIGQNANFSQATAGNAASGLSGNTLDDGTLATTSNLPFTVVNVPNSNTMAGVTVGLGVDPTTAFNIVEVTFNNEVFRVGQTAPA